MVGRVVDTSEPSTKRRRVASTSNVGARSSHVETREAAAFDAFEDESFGHLERGGHPLGVRPLGNLLIDGQQTGDGAESATGPISTYERALRMRNFGLGMFSVLSDELILMLLGTLCDFRAMLHLSACSRSLYAFASHDEIWRELVLDDFGGDFIFCESRWKWTYFLTLAFQNTKLVDASTHKEAVRALAACSVRAVGLYSDALFLPWFAASASIPRKWLSVDNIERRSALSFSVDDFIRDFEVPNRPVLITDEVTRWPAFSKWSPEYLCDVYDHGNARLQAGAVAIPLRRYFEYANNVQEERPLYLFDKKFADKSPHLASDYSVPEFFGCEDLFQYVVACTNDPPRPDYRWLIIGSARSGSTFHIDPNATNAWNAVISGAKKWILYPPGTIPPGIFPSADGAEVTGPVSLPEWLLQFYDQTKKSDVRPIECVCRAGEVVFVPHGWWHAVLNLEPDTIAITQNYVSRRNLVDVLDFLAERADQVSGYHGTGAELNDRLVLAVEARFPGELEKLRANQRKHNPKVSMWQQLQNDSAASRCWNGFQFHLDDESESSGEE